MSKILHIVPGLDDAANGMATVARLLAKEQGDAEVTDLRAGARAIADKAVEEVWVHGLWLPGEWRACLKALRLGKLLVRMTHGSLSPVYLQRQSPWKKRLAAPIERYLLRCAHKVVATCKAEREWISAYERRVREIETVELKRFFELGKSVREPGSSSRNRELHLLYLGRKHPLKGWEYLERAAKGLEGMELKIVDNASGAEKERLWDWCDVLVLPTLSDNFGLVVAEALSRGKRAITTDGAPAWGEGGDYGGKLIYLRGYCDADDRGRVEMLKKALGAIDFG